MKSKFRHIRPLLLVASVLSAAALPSTAQAADYYLQNDQSAGWGWNQLTGGTGWFTSPSGGSNATAMDPAGIYHTRGKILRSTNNATGTDTFGGGTLILENSLFILKTSGAGTAVINHLITQGGSFSLGNIVATGQNLSVSTFEQTDSTRFYADGTSNRGLNLTIGTLSGEGTMTFENLTTNGSTINFSLGITDASAFTGTFSLLGGNLKFTSDLSTAGSLSLATGSNVDLNGKSVTVSSLTVGSTTLDSGTFSAAQLATYGVTATGDGFITVAAIPEPAHAALTVLLAAAGAALALRRRKA
ncbi:glycosyltransferase family 1 [Opitutaceae bacterium TAV5]|nr:glycosyltransferase family 1 [Opitutaceae bacterium TAV5]